MRIASFSAARHIFFFKLNLAQVSLHQSCQAGQGLSFFKSASPFLGLNNSLERIFCHGDHRWHCSLARPEWSPWGQEAPLEHHYLLHGFSHGNPFLTSQGHTFMATFTGFPRGYLLPWYKLPPKRGSAEMIQIAESGAWPELSLSPPLSYLFMWLVWTASGEAPGSKSVPRDKLQKLFRRPGFKWCDTASLSIGQSSPRFQRRGHSSIGSIVP